jgi:triphosphoribosyl-dephospho-CoA synthase
MSPQLLSFPKRAISTVGQIAVNALLDEPKVWPRFGLVGQDDVGAHQDMDYALLSQSANALSTFFMMSAQLGWCNSNRDELFELCREEGMKAETAMFAATHGVNTHKGCIFLLGILAMGWGCAAKRVSEYNQIFSLPTLSEVLNSTYRSAFRTVQRECDYPYQGFSQTYGEWAAIRFGWCGIRESVLSNFFLLRKALEWSVQHPNIYQATRLGFLRHYFFSYTKDTNLLKRAGIRRCEIIRAEAKRLWLQGSLFDSGILQEIVKLESNLIAEELSGAGAGDLMASFLFLDGLLHYGYAKIVSRT